MDVAPVNPTMEQLQANLEAAKAEKKQHDQTEKHDGNDGTLWVLKSIELSRKVREAREAIEKFEKDAEELAHLERLAKYGCCMTTMIEYVQGVVELIRWFGEGDLFDVILKIGSLTLSVVLIFCWYAYWVEDALTRDLASDSSTYSQTEYDGKWLSYYIFIPICIAIASIIAVGCTMVALTYLLDACINSQNEARAELAKRRAGYQAEGDQADNDDGDTLDNVATSDQEV
jgi:hypothetical protein